MLRDRAQTFAFSQFKFDTVTGELTRNGRKLHISDQTARVLTILLQRAGTLVTRDDLRQFLWPHGEFLDYDDAINKAISGIRSVLHDSSRKPRFIETISKRGYRFVAMVTVQESPPIPDWDDGNHRDKISAAVPQMEGTQAEIKATKLLNDNAVIAVSDRSEQTTAVRDSSKRFRPVWVITAALVLVVVGIAVFMVAQRRKGGAPNYIYIGIAPFETSGSDADKLAESLRLDIADAIAQLPSIRVRAAHSFTKNARGDVNVRSLAQKLQVDVLLFSTLALDGDRCVLAFELVRGQDATHIASFHYSGTKKELARIRDRVQRDIFTQLQLSSNGSNLAHSNTTNAQAYEAYLRGRYGLSEWTDDSLPKAIEDFRVAVDADPMFGRAYAGMASTYLTMADHDLMNQNEGYTKAKELATKALHIDPSLAEAHAVLGYVTLLRDWNFSEAERELRRAVELDSGQAMYHLWLAILLTDQGRFEEALEQNELAQASDPLWPAVYITEVFVADSARLHTRAGLAAQKVVQMVPNQPLAHAQYAWFLWYSGRHAEAISEWRQMAVLENDVQRIRMEERGLEALKHGGVVAYAQVRLEAIQSGGSWRHKTMDFVPAEWYTVAGNHEIALAKVEEMVKNHDSAALRFAVNPMYNDFHRDPQFLAILSRVGISLPRSYPKPPKAA